MTAGIALTASFPISFAPYRATVCNFSFFPPSRPVLKLSSTPYSTGPCPFGAGAGAGGRCGCGAGIPRGGSSGVISLGSYSCSCSAMVETDAGDIAMACGVVSSLSPLGTRGGGRGVGTALPFSVLGLRTCGVSSPSSSSSPSLTASAKLRVSGGECEACRARRSERPEGAESDGVGVSSKLGTDASSSRLERLGVCTLEADLPEAV